MKTKEENEMTAGKWFLFTILTVIAFLAPLHTSHACLGCIANSGRTKQRACFANIKTLCGAIEMYELDHNIDVHEVSEELLEKLLANGYLQTPPLCPYSRNPDSWRNYRFASNGEIFCIHHGFISLDSPDFSRHLSPYDQLILAGETKSGLLEAASRKSPTAKTKADEIAEEIYVSSNTYGMVAFVLLFVFLLPIGIRRAWTYVALSPLCFGGLLLPAAIAALIGMANGQLLTGGFICLSFYLLMLSIWSFGFLRKGNNLEQLISPLKKKILDFDDSTAALFSSAFTAAADRYLAVIVAMGIFLTIIGISGTYTLFQGQPHINDVPAPLLITFICVTQGMLSGVLRFISSLNSGAEQPGNDGTHPGLRVVLTIFIPGYYLYLYLQGLYYLDTSYRLMGGFIPLTIACFLIGRAAAAFTLNRKFVRVYEELRTQNQTFHAIKKDATNEELDSLEGMSATPSRGVS